MVHEFMDGVMIDIPKGIVWDEDENTFCSADNQQNISGRIFDVGLYDNDERCDLEHIVDVILKVTSKKFNTDAPTPTFVNNSHKIGFVVIPLEYEQDGETARIVNLIGAVQVDEETAIVFQGNCGWRFGDEEENLERFSLLVKTFRGITIDGEKITLNSFSPAKILKKYVSDDSFSKLEIASFDKGDINLPDVVFSNDNTEMFDSNIIIPIPDGFVAHSNTGYMQQQEDLIVITEGYTDLENYFDAPFVLTVQKLPINIKSGAVNKQTIDYYEGILRRGNGFVSDADVLRFGFRDGFIAFSQSLVDFDCPTYNKLKSYVCTDNGIYQCSITCNHSYDASDDDVIECFVERASRWLEAIRVVGEKEFATFPTTHAGDDLYTFYEQTMSMKKNSLPGVTVRTSGFAYEFVPLAKQIKNRGFSLESKEAEEQILELLENADNDYTLWQQAERIAPIFRVSKQAFNFKNDKECALMEGLAREAYMLSALRSFAWTVSAYCEEENLDPEDLSIETLQDIIFFIEGREWLNYNNQRYCKGLCGCDDINVVYTTTQIPPLMIMGFMGEAVQCNSLNALRQDLEYIYPAIEQLYLYLQNDRNIDDALVGNEADILYMWCVLAMAAKSSFHIDNGPSTRVFEQISDNNSSNHKTTRKTTPPKNSKANPKGPKVHFDNNIKYVTLAMDDVVAAHGELLSYEGDEKNVIFPEGITEIGDSFESSVLFENIVIPEGVTRIGEKAFASQYRLKSVVLPSTLEVIDEEAFSECLLLESVTLPYGLTNIEKSAFETCDSLKMIVIPDTVQTIGDSAFYGCGYLKNIFLQGEVDDLHEDAFYGINNDVVLHIQPDGDIEEHCESNYLKYDYESAEEYVPEKEKRVAEKSSLSDFVIDEVGVLKSYHGHAKIVEIPDNVKEIYLFAFAHHHEIEKVIISEGVEKIGGGAFSCCLLLNEIVLPTTLRIVGGVAFSECISLEKISFAPGVETLEGSLFHENTKDIYLPESVKNIDNNAIYSSSNQILHVPEGSIAEKYAKKQKIQFDNESDPMMQKYVEKVEAINRQKEEGERKAREEAERKAREEEAERQRIREENERKAREEAERLAREQAQILKQREEFIASETEAAENQYQETVAELTAKFEKKDNELTIQIDELKKKLIQLEQELAGASFFAFSRKRQLKNEIQTANSSITAMEDEKKILSGEHQIQLNDAQTKRKNQLASLPMRAVKKFPVPSKLRK